MSKRILALVFAAAILVALAVPLFSGGGRALATHEHWLVTPGTTVEDIASGQTSNDGNGCHKFHDHVHKGEPGLDAFQNPNNPVAVFGATNLGCP